MATDRMERIGTDPVLLAAQSKAAAEAQCPPAIEAPAAQIGLRRMRLLQYWTGEAAGNLPPGRPAGDVSEILAALLHGDTSPLQHRPVPVTVEFAAANAQIDDSAAADAGLDAHQRSAVAALVGTPDLFLLQGEPGTGKSRVLLEAIRRIVRRDERVLVVAPQAHAGDSLLLQLQYRADVLGVRCLGTQSETRSLPAELQAATIAECAKRLAGEIRQRSGVMKAQWQKELGGLDHDLQRLVQFRSLASQWRELSERRATLEAQRQQIPSEVQAESRQTRSAAIDSDWLKGLQVAQQRHAAAQQELEERRSSAQADLQAKRQEHDKWQAQTRNQQQVVVLRDQRRWFSFRWWRAFFQGRVEERLKEFQCRASEASQAVAIAEEQLAEIDKQHELEDQRHLASLEQIVATETANRLEGVNRRLGDTIGELDKCREQWLRLRALLAGRERLSETPDADQLERFRNDSDERRREIERCREIAQARLKTLESSSAAIMTSVWQFANLVVGSFAAWSQELQTIQGQTAAVFDWVVAEDSDAFSEQELVRLAQHGRHLILVGRTPLPETGADGTAASAAGQCPFQRLWHTLHCNPRRLPFQWIEEGDTLIYQRRPLTADERQHLEKEPVTDLPDVELHILAAAGADPVLAEVVFPRHTFRIADAKKYLYQQLDELALRPESRAIRWQRTGRGLHAELHEGDSDSGSEIHVELEPGVQEVVRPAVVARSQTSRQHSTLNGRDSVHWCTARLIFDCEQGWDDVQAGRWLRDRAGLHDWRRTAMLTTLWRSTARIAGFWTSVLHVADAFLPRGEEKSLPTSSGTEGGVVTWAETASKLAIPAQPSLVSASSPERKGRPITTKPLQRAAPKPPPEAVLEVDLSDSRLRQRLPLELQMKLPLRGVVNMAEAQAIIQTVTERVKEWESERARESERSHSPVVPFSSVSRLAVLTFQSAQVQLLEFLWAKSAAAKAPVCFATAQQFRGREAEAVLVGLCRNNPSAPVTYASYAEEWRTILSSARSELLLFGDRATLSRASKGSAVDWEKSIAARLLAYFNDNRVSSH